MLNLRIVTRLIALLLLTTIAITYSNNVTISQEIQTPTLVKSLSSRATKLFFQNNDKNRSTLTEQYFRIESNNPFFCGPNNVKC